MEANRFKHPVSREITDQYIRSSSCLQCKPCGGNCIVVDNRISFVVDPETRRVRHLLFDSTPVACMGNCIRPCQESLRLVRKLKPVSEQLEFLKIISIYEYHQHHQQRRSYTRARSRRPFFCEESWITQSRAASRSEEAFPEEVIEIKNEGISMEQLQT